MFRAHAERLATMRFRRLASELKETGASSVVIALAESAVEDEVRHAALCDALAELYGGEGAAHACDLKPPPPLGPEGLSKEDRVLFEVMAFCCFTETVNTAMLVETVKQTEATEIRSVAQEILKDEVSHSRLGWAHLHAMRERGKGGFLSETLPYMLRTGEVEAIFREDLRREDEQLVAYGELNYARRTGIFRAVTRDVVWPGLASLGISPEPGQAWLVERQLVEA
ncbi:MAG: hypothetical protein ACPGU1_21195 [Myxococcota bacterium]